MTEIEEKRARDARNAYRREWAKRNPEKIRAAQMRYWAKRAASAESEKAREK